ncbi:hypothetical protein LCGC14_1583750 [marine sediment metagenome]|uniref:Uncharacterized protein n=1 Tax=marine sediment metagenome TaxID=412755 RepID=A0A0F9KWS0_9ZZZZ
MDKVFIQYFADGGGFDQEMERLSAVGNTVYKD